MRILALTNLYPRPGHELMAAFNRQQFRALAAKHELRVIAPIPWHEALADAARGKAAAKQYRNGDGIEVCHPTYYYLPRVASHRYGQFYLHGVREHFERQVRDFRPDVLLACWADPDGWAAVQLARESGLPLVTKVVGSDVLVLGRHPRRRERISQALRQADAVVAVSRDLADHVEYLGADRRRVRVVPEGIDRRLFSPGDRAAARERLGIVAGTLRVPSQSKVAAIGAPAQWVDVQLQSSSENDQGYGTRSVPATFDDAHEKIILFVGNLLLSKGAGVLVEALAGLRGEIANCKLQIANCKLNDDDEGNPKSKIQNPKSGRLRCYLVGTGRDERKLRAMIEKYGLSEAVKLVGPCDHERLADWYRACDVVALPSFSEGIPNVLREAMECGRPFVATRVGGIPEIAHPAFSRLVAPGDAAGLAEALAEMLDGREKGTGTFCRNGPEGASHKTYLSPFHVDPLLVRERNVTWEDSAEMLAEVLQRASGQWPVVSGQLARRNGQQTNPRSQVQSPRSAGPRPSSGRPLACPEGEGTHPSSLIAHPSSSAANPKSNGLRILAITNQYPRLARDGLATFNQQQFRELAASHELRIVAPVPWPDALGDWLRFDARPTRYRSRDAIWIEHPRFLYLPKAWQHRHGDLFLRSVRPTVQRLLAEFQPDVVLGSWAFPDGWAAVRLAREAGLPVVIKVHGSDILVLTRDPQRRRLIAEALAEADRVVAVSDDLARHVVELGVPAERVCVVRNGIDGELFSPGDQAEARERLRGSDGERERGGDGETERIVSFVGNILLSKGAGVLVEAMARLREETANCKLQIANCKLNDDDEGNPKSKSQNPESGRLRCYLVGAGKDAGKVRRMIARYGLDECVKLVGPCPQPRLVDWYRACDVVALPSFSEGIPNVLQEAISCGRPFVATRVGGIPEIAHPSFSRLVAPGDADELAAALAEMLAFPPIVDPALVAAQTISWQESAAQLAEVLEGASRPLSVVGSQ